ASVNQKNFQALSRMSAHFLDVLQGLNTLKLFNRSRAETSKIYIVSEAYRKTTMQTLRIAFLSSGVLEFFAACSVALLATYLGLSLLHDLHFGQPIDLYSALLILLLAPEFFLPLRELSTYYHARASAIGAAEELMTLLDLKAPVYSVTLGESLKLDQVDFTYPHSSAPVLKKYCLEVSAGEHIALIGPSGKGKSTILALLLGFLKPDSGEVTSLPHSQIGWLSQNPTLFAGTLRSNLLMANPNASEPELWEALDQVFMRETVQHFPMGLDTPINEQNQGLSGGQVQRIALARLYLKTPMIFLLDEPTASLDPESATAVINSLAQHTQGKTLILVTHRLEPLLKMHRVVTL
ncbi:MAG: ATP-binding cassette domain-containing protein, partial [Gammaproteobacteria bacterium]|nr:ATP-binding cassette domain-containing protein [Gammaproteobacteria bacterium]